MALRPHVQDALGAAPLSPKPGTGAGDLTPEQEYRVRVMGEEELELLRAAASQEDGLHLASLNWILASLANHGFVTISPSNDRRLRAAATKAGHLALEMRPCFPRTF
jgi:hypothetical protein